MENDFGPGKSWNLLGCERKSSLVCTPLVFVIHSSSDRTFFATCDSDIDEDGRLLYVE